MITAVGNPRMKQLVQLNQKAKARREQGVFVVEGIKMFLEAPKNWVREVYVSESFYFNTPYQEKIKEYKYEIVSDDVFKKVSDTVTPQGILCVVQQHHYTINDMLVKENPMLVMLENLQDPGNLGTIMRTGEGAGIDGIIMTKETVDIYNPKTIRATMGSIYRVPFIYVEDLVETMSHLQQSGVSIYAAHLKGRNFHDEENYQGGTAFLIGNEGNGLTDESAKKADVYIKIPMEGEVESLNAAIATTILMYEANRQRR